MKLPQLAIRDDLYKWFALGTTVIGAFASVFNSTSTNIALPKMMAAFSVGATDAQWIISGYNLTFGVLQPVSGYLCDRFGAKRIYLISLLIFIFGSGLCGTAWSNESMVAFRIIQALGGSFVFPSSMYIVFSVFRPQERNMALGIWGLSISLAPALGPCLGGYLVDYWDWPYVYFINLPIGVLGLIAALFVLKETKTAGKTNFDFLGFFCSSIGLFCLLLALSKGVDDGWDAPYIIALFYTAFAMLTLFVLIEITVKDPLLDLSLFRDTNFALGNIILSMVQFLLMGSVYVVSLFLQHMMGYSAMDAGIFLLPSAAAGLVMSPLAGKLAGRFGEKPLVIAGFLLSVWWTSRMATVSSDTEIMLIILMQTLRGASIGMTSMTATVLSMQNIARDKIGRANAMINTSRQVSSSFAITAMATIMQQRQIFHQEHIAEHINFASGAFRKLIDHTTQMFVHNSGNWGLAHKKAMAFLAMAAQKQSVYFSYDDAFFVLEVFAIVGLIAALLTKGRKQVCKTINSH